MSARPTSSRPRSWGRDAIGLLILLTCFRVWISPAPMLETARAQIPDSGMQRKLLLDETRQTNQLLRDIRQLLKEHTLNVRIRGADNQADAPAPRPKRDR